MVILDRWLEIQHINSRLCGHTRGSLISEHSGSLVVPLCKNHSQVPICAVLLVVFSFLAAMTEYLRLEISGG